MLTRRTATTNGSAKRFGIIQPEWSLRSGGFGAEPSSVRAAAEGPSDPERRRRPPKALTCPDCPARLGRAAAGRNRMRFPVGETTVLSHPAPGVTLR
ncbi:hypothetical protein FRAAL3580 [Frankia alni ACN14a]|uniref:Uncharacterized protein n=1 Tax=Frankia alni (strain DSM 45986 / CECT 9034 / ACN14a) TaxID=326424 RepID=Q0RJT7_FRAAA|nr:hypothetical protein FRAAL3580 [Frankia alni ACN14a]